jgi:hypothetical protein
MLGPSKDVEGQKNVFLVVMKTKQESKFQMKKPGGHFWFGIGQSHFQRQGKERLIWKRCKKAHENT